jgi:hypothetical protein
MMQVKVICQTPGLEQNLFTFHRSFTVQLTDVEHIIIQIPTFSTNRIPIQI